MSTSKIESSVSKIRRRSINVNDSIGRFFNINGTAALATPPKPKIKHRLGSIFIIEFDIFFILITVFIIKIKIFLGLYFKIMKKIIYGDFNFVHFIMFFFFNVYGRHD